MSSAERAAGVLTALALRHITDDRNREAFAEGVTRLSRGEAVELGPAVSFGRKH